MSLVDQAIVRQSEDSVLQHEEMLADIERRHQDELDVVHAEREKLTKELHSRYNDSLAMHTTAMAHWERSQALERELEFVKSEAAIAIARLNGQVKTLTEALQLRQQENTLLLERNADIVRDQAVSAVWATLRVNPLARTSLSPLASPLVAAPNPEVSPTAAAASATDRSSPAVVPTSRGRRASIMDFSEMDRDATLEDVHAKAEAAAAAADAAAAAVQAAAEKTRVEAETAAAAAAALEKEAELERERRRLKNEEELREVERKRELAKANQQKERELREQQLLQEQKEQELKKAKILEQRKLEQQQQAAMRHKLAQQVKMATGANTSILHPPVLHSAVVLAELTPSSSSVNVEVVHAEAIRSVLELDVPVLAPTDTTSMDTATKIPEAANSAAAETGTITDVQAQARPTDLAPELVPATTATTTTLLETVMPVVANTASKLEIPSPTDGFSSSSVVVESVPIALSNAAVTAVSHEVSQPSHSPVVTAPSVRVCPLMSSSCVVDVFVSTFLQSFLHKHSS